MSLIRAEKSECSVQFPQDVSVAQMPGQDPRAAGSCPRHRYYGVSRDVTVPRTVAARSPDGDYPSPESRPWLACPWARGASASAPAPGCPAITSAGLWVPGS